ncbi:MAG: protein kinase [Planctomycetales bacterium]|nr:protein kinase [Planctomycetales bacterium]
MPLGYRTGEEPLPGFRLRRFLGDGTFGAVWQAVAPGGTEVAIKFIDLRNSHGNKELKSLQIIKRLRHPNLVPLLGYWLKDEHGRLIDPMRDTNIFDTSITDTDPGEAPSASQRALSSTVVPTPIPAEQPPEPVELIVVMGLGDMSLYDRLRRAQESGALGIEPSELIRYMEDAARGIDFLNTARHSLRDQTVAIQHCDIKPQNILIVGGAAQLCDLGLARIVDDTRNTRAAFTAAYGAPECFRGSQPSPWTDQYSLAISYVELRTGRLPFSDQSSPASVIQQHLESRLDLSMLNESEQFVIRKATSLVPTERYESAIAMVDDLRRANVANDLASLAAFRPAASHTRRHKFALACAVGLIAMATIGLGMFGREQLRALLTTAATANTAASANVQASARSDPNSRPSKSDSTSEASLVASDERSVTTLDEVKDTQSREVSSPLTQTLASPTPQLTDSELAAARYAFCTVPRTLTVHGLQACVAATRAQQLNALYANGRLQLATDSLFNAANEQFSSLCADGWLRLATDSLARRDVESAVSQIERVLQLQPNRAEAYLLRGRLAAQQSDLAAAIGWYDKAIQFDETLTDAHALRGIANCLRSEPHLARRDLSVALRLTPTDERARRMRALVHTQLEMYVEAVQDREHFAQLPGRSFNVVLPLQLDVPEVTVRTADGVPVTLYQNHPLQLISATTSQLVVSFQYEGHRYEATLQSDQVRPNVKF